jgi:hypothetical protein
MASDRGLGLLGLRGHEHAWAAWPSSSRIACGLGLGGLAALGQVGLALRFSSDDVIGLHDTAQRRLGRLGRRLGGAPLGSLGFSAAAFSAAASLLGLGGSFFVLRGFCGLGLRRRLGRGGFGTPPRRRTRWRSSAALAGDALCSSRWRRLLGRLLPGGAARRPARGLGLAALQFDSSAAAASAALSSGVCESSRLTKTRFLRTSTWIVRALPDESACLISVVDLRVSVIFLRSAPRRCRARCAGTPAGAPCRLRSARRRATSWRRRPMPTARSAPRSGA